MSKELLSELERRMKSGIEAFQKELQGLRTGRASVNLLDPIKINAYGALMPLNQVASVTAPEPRLLVVQVWDRDQVKLVEKAIREANLGLNPAAEGQTIRVPLPELSQERRQELCKIAHKYAEQTRVAIRNVRRDGLESTKKMEKDKLLSEDDRHRLEKDIQDLTDKIITKIDELLAVKEKDIMSV